MVAGVLVAGTADNHALAGNTAAVVRRLQSHGHFAPFIERLWAAELDAVFVDGNRVGAKLQPGVTRSHAHRRLNRIYDDQFFRTHKRLINSNTPVRSVKLYF